MRRHTLAIFLCFIAAPVAAQQADPWPVLSQPYSAQDTIRAAGVGVFAPNARTPVRIQTVPVEPERRPPTRIQRVRPPRPLLPPYHPHQNRHHRGHHRGHQ